MQPDLPLLDKRKEGKAAAGADLEHKQLEVKGEWSLDGLSRYVDEELEVSGGQGLSESGKRDPSYFGPEEFRHSENIRQLNKRCKRK